MSKKKTHEDFEKEYYTKFPDSPVVFKSNYTGANEKIKCYCKVHDYTWETSPNTLLRGSGKCPKCSNCAQKTHEEFVEQYFKKFPDAQVEFLTKYITREDKILCKCKIDGNEWETTPFQLMQGSICPICYKNNYPLLKNKDKYAEEFYQKYNNKYILLSEYKGAEQKIHIKHEECGREFWVRAGRTLEKQREILCPFCSRKAGNKKKEKPHKTTEQFKEEIFNLVGDEYKVLGEYERTHRKISFLHNTEDCQNIFEMTPNGFLSGNRCPICSCKKGHEKLSKLFTKSKEKFLEDIKNKFHGKIILIGEYIDSHTETKFKCNKHNIEFINTPRNVFVSQTGCCPICSLNKGEDCYLWKGGMSELKDFGRAQIKEWNKKSIEWYGSKCIITGEHVHFTIHHAIKGFSEIFYEVVEELKMQNCQTVSDVSKEQLDKFSKLLLEKHFQYGYGVPISIPLHNEFHSIYGFGSNTIDQLIEFASTKGVTLIKILDEQNRIKLERVEKDNTQDGK